MAKKIYLSHPFGGLEENREAAAALAKMFREIWAAEGKDFEIVNPIEYLAPLSEGFQEWEILKLAVNLLKSCDDDSFKIFHRLITPNSVCCGLPSG